MINLNLSSIQNLKLSKPQNNGVRNCGMWIVSNTLNINQV